MGVELWGEAVEESLRIPAVLRADTDYHTQRMHAPIRAPRAKYGRVDTKSPKGRF